MLENAEINRFLLGLYAPRYGVARRDVDPADEVRLFGGQLAGHDATGAGQLALLCTSSCSIPAMAASCSDCVWAAGDSDCGAGVVYYGGGVWCLKYGES